MKYSYVAKTVVINPEGKCLVLRRSPTDQHAPGRADLPGGGVEQDEAYAVSAAREIAEEAGISVAPEALQLVYTSTRLASDGGAVIVRFLYLVEIAGSEVTLSYEHDAYEWLEVVHFQAALAGTAWSEAVDFLIARHILPSA